MDIKEFANLLNGREYGYELTKEEDELAKQLGYVIVFGYSDDCMELRGAIYDEVSAFGGRNIKISQRGLFIDHNCNNCNENKNNYNILKARYGKEYFWEYYIDVHFECFSIMEDEDKYCRGIIFKLNDLKH